MIFNWGHFLDIEAPAQRNALRFRAFMRSCFKPFTDINKDAVYKLGHTGQKASLEHRLNDEYNLPYVLADRANLILSTQIIYLERYLQNDILLYIFLKNEGQPPTYIYKSTEGQPPVHVYSSYEVLGPYDFTVYVPNTLTFNQNALKALIYQYVAPTARFQIVTY